MNQTKLLFIDSKVENCDRLISQVDPQTKVVILQPNKNGIDQISKSLSECHSVDTVHIISHGAKGALYVGNSILKNDNIHLYVESIQQWGKCLSADGEILIYGCEVASGKEGREFVRQLHQLTGANIAASETLTGNVSKGGNWNLEVIFGQLKSALAFTPEVRGRYAGVLANIVVDTTNDVVDDSDSVTSLREAIIEANSTPEDDTIQLTAGATYDLTIPGSDENAAATGDLDIVAGGGEITIISEGEEQAVIDAGGETGIGDRVFHVLAGAALELENVDIIGGFFIINRFVPSITQDSGGGIFNLGTANLTNSTIYNNSGNNGGGIFNLGTVNISESNISGNFGGDSGGGIHNTGTINLSNSTISGNNTVFYGGGIHNLGEVNVTNSNITHHSINLKGAGIFSSGTASISNSTIHRNTSVETMGSVYNSGIISINDSTISSNNGSGIDNSYQGRADINNSNIIANRSITAAGLRNSGRADINNSNISNNSALNSGGGISNGGTLNISKSTISGNDAKFRGGGISNRGTANINDSTISSNNGGGVYNPGTANISNSTITRNQSSDEGNGILTRGINRSNFVPTTTLTSTIVSGNLNTDFYSIGNNDIFISGGNNLIGTGDPIKYFDGYNDQTGVTDPLLGDLADNGGLTLTHLPLPNSPAIDAGSNPNSLTTDQRGKPRLAREAVDIGAVELEATPEIIGTPESEVLDGTSDDDTITGLAGNDTIDGGGGDDKIIGGRGNDSLFGQNGNDTLQGGNGRDVLNGGAGNDTLNSGNGRDVLNGGNSRDVLNGGAGNDTLNGGNGRDRLVGRNGRDVLKGGAGNDTLNSGKGRDRLVGGNGRDVLNGGAGNDTLNGGVGNDTLNGGVGSDRLVGGNGRDILNGGAGNDTLIGGVGVDRFIYNTNQEFAPEDVGVDTITDFTPGRDIILLDKTTFTAITSDSGTGFSVNAEFAIVTSDADAETSSAFIVYNSNNGKLFYNANGTEAEFGSGGEFANLSNNPSISEDDFFFRG